MFWASRYPSDLSIYQSKGEGQTSCVGQPPLSGLLASFRKRVFTVTSDNGKEFAQHDLISKELKSRFFFAHPYHSWERGLNENTNGLIRQYFPKATNFKTITDDQVQAVIDRLNNRSRKTLGFKTPNEVFLDLKYKLAA